jgi:hypothetical protein
VRFHQAGQRREPHAKKTGFIVLNAFTFFRPPLFPEIIGVLGLSIPGPGECLDIKRICPADMIGAPTDETMKKCIRFVIGANGNTEGAG